MYSAKKIAQWFINRAAMDAEMSYGEYVTNMKLQKLLYFAQGFSYAINGKPLFDENIKAWPHGPVVPVIYHTYKVLHANPIMDVEPVEIDDDTAALLEFVFRKFGKYSASELRNISHSQMPFIKNYVEDDRNRSIPNADIKSEFEKNCKAIKKEFEDCRTDLIDFAETCYINSVPGLKEKILENDDLVEVDWKHDL